jgi:hypothetical protein
MISIAIVKYFYILYEMKITERSDMSRLASLCSAIRHLVRTRPSPGAYEADRPASLAEIVAASAFLDFGGMPSGDWLHAWEATVERDRRPEGDELPSTALRPGRAIGNKCSGKSVGKKIIGLERHRSEHAAYDFVGRPVFPFRDRDGALMLSIDSLNGPPRMGLDDRPRALELALCVAAFGFIAGMLVLAHPALPTSRGATPIKADAGAAASASMPPATALTRLTGRR